MGNMLKEFKEFAIRGPVIDLAVGVIIGGAFGQIVTSLVNDILMPILSILIGGISFTDLKVVISPATDTAAEVAFMYGSFIQSVVDFLIIALCIFLFVKLATSLSRKEPEPEPAPPEPSNEETLLREIRDLLKEK
jgi:large conductance mechanosensitive channel